MDNADETAGGQSRSHGQGKVGRMSKRISSDLDLDNALHTLDGSIEKLGEAPSTIAWADFKRLHMELSSDLSLVKRTLEQIARRVK